MVWWGIQLLSKTLNAAIYSLHHVCTAHCQETVSSFSTNSSWRSWQNGETTGQDYGIAQKLASERWMCWRGLVRMEQRQRKRSKKWNSPKKKNWDYSTKQKRLKAEGGMEARGRTAQVWYENFGKQSNFNQHKIPLTYTATWKRRSQGKIGIKDT